MDAPVTKPQRRQKTESGLSYKFQRLREKLRKAIETGELSGKLPGERALSRRFHVNAKTLSKALTDLAAEGLLDRSIGRGTYVKGSAPASAALGGPWLLLCDADQQNSCTAVHLREAYPEIEVASGSQPMRPSFINQFAAVINLSPSTPETLIRDLLVRNIPLVAIGHEPRTYSVHAVLPDVSLGASRLGRDLLLAGHRKLGAIEPPGGGAISQVLRQIIARYAIEATVQSAQVAQVADLLSGGATALVCGSVTEARDLRAALAAQQIDVPARISIGAIGCTCPHAQCSGYFVECRALVDAAVSLLSNPPSRPTTLWLSGQWIDRSTIAPLGGGLTLDQSSPLRVSGVVV